MISDRRSTGKTTPAGKRRPGRKRGPGEHSGLDHAQIVKMAVQLAEEHGAEALNVREIAARLGVTPAAIYWHVKSRNELFDEVVKTVFADLVPPQLHEGSWRERTRALLVWFHHRLTERAALLSAVASSAALPFAFIHVGIALAEILGAAGFDDDERRMVTRALMAMTIGMRTFESASKAQWAAGGTLVDMEQAAQRLGQAQLLTLVNNLSQMRDFDFDAVFLYALDRVLDGLEGRARARKRS